MRDFFVWRKSDDCNQTRPRSAWVFGGQASLIQNADCLLLADSVEKVDLLLGLRQNQVIGQREDSQHDGTIVERTREAVLLVQH